MILEQLELRKQTNKIVQLFPDDGPLSRHAYPKHMAFYKAGLKHRERLFLAANRVGKTIAGGYEVALHLTGLYPSWWPGRRFNHRTKIWAAGDTNQTVRDILQVTLLGEPGQEGTGLIPKRLITRTRPRGGGVPDAIESIFVKHASGGISRCVLKSYDQKRKAFQGTAQDVIWCDEEPPLDIYAECLLRTMTTDGMAMLTFTPLLGMSDVVRLFLPDGRVPIEGEGEVVNPLDIKDVKR